MSGYKTEVELCRPQAGEARQIAMQPGHAYVLDFEPYTAEFTLDGADLYFTFDNGAVLSLKDFMIAAAAGDFTLRLPDGVQISGKDTAESLNLSPESFHTDGLLASLQTEAPLFAETRTETEHSAAGGTRDAIADMLQAPCSPAADDGDLRPWWLIFSERP
jgi:hypothetical protein